MDLTVPQEVTEFGSAAKATLADPNLDRARQAQAGEDAAIQEVVLKLHALGIDDLDVLAQPDTALAAGELARQVGRVGAPVPIVAMLTARALGYSGALHALGGETETLIDHADGDLAPLGASIDGTVWSLHVLEPHDPSRLLAPRASVCALRDSIATDLRAWPFHEILSAFASLGAVEHALELCADHLRQREQFGRPLGSFQALQHRLADIAVLVAGLRELAYYSMSRWSARPEGALPEALMAREHHLDVVRQVFRHAHQIHGAIGFCDEHPLAVLSKSVQLRQYVPLTVDATMLHLLDHLEQLDLPFPLVTNQG